MIFVVNSLVKFHRHLFLLKYLRRDSLDEHDIELVVSSFDAHVDQGPTVGDDLSGVHTGVMGIVDSLDLLFCSFKMKTGDISLGAQTIGK